MSPMVAPTEDENASSCGYEYFRDRRPCRRPGTIRERKSFLMQPKGTNFYSATLKRRPFHVNTKKSKPIISIRMVRNFAPRPSRGLSLEVKYTEGGDFMSIRRNRISLWLLGAVGAILVIGFLAYVFTGTGGRPSERSPVAAAEDDSTKSGSPVSKSTMAGKEDVKEGIEVGMRAPDFTLKDLKGKVFRLSDLRGQPVFLNFFATWCPPCRGEMPDIERVHRDFQGKVTVVAISIQQSQKTVRSFVNANKLSFRVLLDSSGDVAQTYQVAAIPTSLFIDAQGVIRYKRIGAMTYEDMVNGIKEASST